jgi:hypothetical protein
MTHTTEIKINDKTYKAVFNNLALRKYSEGQGIKSVDDAIRSILTIADFKKDDAGNLVLDENDQPIVLAVQWKQIDNVIHYLKSSIDEATRQGLNAESASFEDLYCLTDDQQGWQQLLPIVVGVMPVAEKESLGNQ